MAIRKSAERVEEIKIDKLKLGRTMVRIVGDTPLIVHAWSEKARRQMLEAQTGKKKGKERERKNPVDDCIQAAYWLTGKPSYGPDATEEECKEAFKEAVESGATFGFPAIAFKKATTANAYRLGWIKNQMGMRGAFYIESDENGLIPIKFESVVMREDMVKIGGGTADIRYRPQFNGWSADLLISYNESGEFSLQNILNAINAGGYACGVGEWRPERDGSFGRYHIETL